MAAQIHHRACAAGDGEDREFRQETDEFFPAGKFHRFKVTNYFPYFFASFRPNGYFYKANGTV